eukprot:3012436-Pleurochrysis_carterae.AAC.4
MSLGLISLRIWDPPDSVLSRRYSNHPVACCCYFHSNPIGHAHTRPRCAHAQRGRSARRPCRSPSLFVASQP